MKGFIHFDITDDGRGFRCQCNLSNVKLGDKMQMLGAMIEAMEMSWQEVMLTLLANEIDQDDFNLKIDLNRLEEQLKGGKG